MSSAEQTDLEREARAWIAGFRNERHLVRTRDWALVLEPGAGEALVLAALLHDVERELSGVALAAQIARWDDEDEVRAHAERSAKLVAAWLRERGAREELVAAVVELIRLHETGGTPEADVLQAADSLSFLETNPARAWVVEGKASRGAARSKLRSMLERIRIEAARPAASALYERAAAGLEETPSTFREGGAA